jgi:hypothetical protein
MECQAAKEALVATVMAMAVATTTTQAAAIAEAITVVAILETKETLVDVEATEAQTQILLATNKEE